MQEMDTLHDRLQIYAGKNSNLATNDSGLCSCVVLELLNGLENHLLHFSLSFFWLYIRKMWNN